MTLHLEYLTDKNGKPKAVVIPDKEWRLYQADYNKTKKKLEILLGLERAIGEVRDIQRSRKKGKALREFLNEV